MLDHFTRMMRDYGSRDAEVRADLRVASRVPGAIGIDELRPRRHSRIAGVVSAVTRSCIGDSPRLKVMVSDGTGEVQAQFLGRRDISGLRPGALVVLEGRFCERDGELVAHNPVYELIQTGDDHD
ncbi:ATP-dependent DNA helicase RecG [Brevibacterium sanguinis]|uniref:ATP-dependent DNA helicase RecG n=2 Tax=Brevibacterium TaxID=1696 RepID=A0A366IHA9_9MICO|nr:MULTISPECIES: OB-fold nucleic acid binding domain-containing protein [Brevibacterium]RBP64002.1 ATP-dependent DNA helicase RecG [Brevibacterium sanguinis]RBP70723.1 ATP-dependent DNA helicase RecG [Brevibacterium celere]